MNYSNAAQVEAPKSSVGKELLERFEKNINWLSSNVNQLEERCHLLLNQRTPEAEGKQTTPIENDFASSVKNKLDLLDILNSRFEKLILHLDRFLA